MCALRVVCRLVFGGLVPQEEVSMTAPLLCARCGLGLNRRASCFDVGAVRWREVTKARLPEGTLACPQRRQERSGEDQLKGGVSIWVRAGMATLCYFWIMILTWPVVMVS